MDKIEIFVKQSITDLWLLLRDRPINPEKAQLMTQHIMYLKPTIQQVSLFFKIRREAHANFFTIKDFKEFMSKYIKTDYIAHGRCNIGLCGGSGIVPVGKIGSYDENWVYSLHALCVCHNSTKTNVHRLEGENLMEVVGWLKKYNMEINPEFLVARKEEKQRV